MLLLDRLVVEHDGTRIERRRHVHDADEFQSLKAALRRNRVPSLGIGFRRRREALDRGSRSAKIKADGDPAADRDRAKAIRKAVGSGMHLRADANADYAYAKYASTEADARGAGFATS